jgi:predicted RNase H-like nuclease
LYPRGKGIRTAQFKLKIDELAFFAPSLARKTQSVTRKRVNVTHRSRTHLAGVDGCRRGWIVVHTASDIAHAEITFVSHWREIHHRFDIVAVDMPIGLSDRGHRECESAARKILSPHGARVFRVPPRGALRFGYDKWSGANSWSKRQGFGGISKQSWNIWPKIAEIDGAIVAADQRRIHEAHPELAFARLNAGKALVSKHTDEGLKARKRLLRKAGFPNLDDWLAQRRALFAKPDDILDASALLLTALRLKARAAIALPRVAPRDSRGLKMAIHY